MMSSSHAMEEEGRRFPGTVPIATILLVSSTRYKINGAQAIALTDITSRRFGLSRLGEDARYASPPVGEPDPGR